MARQWPKEQVAREWQNLAAFQGKKGHENVRQASIYNFRDKCVVFAHNRKFAKLTQLTLTVDKISYEDHDSSTADVSNNLPVLLTKNAAERIVIHVSALV